MLLTNFWEQVKNFFQVSNYWLLLFIFFARAIEVSIGTLRVIVMNKGYKNIGAILAFIEVLIWVFVASEVIKDISSEPMRGIVYSLGFAAGVWLGTLFEDKIALGKILIQVVCEPDKAEAILEAVRIEGFGATEVEAQGKGGKKKMLYIYTNRKFKNKVFNLINEIDEDAFITSNQIDEPKGGYFRSRRILK